MYYFDTKTPMDDLLSIINYDRAVSYYDNLDRPLFGLPVVVQEQEIVSLQQFCPAANGTEYFGLETNRFSILRTISEYIPNLTIKGAVDITKHPWNTRVITIDVVRNYPENCFAELVDMDARANKRAHDLAFIVYVQKTQQNIAVHNISSIFGHFKSWLDSDSGIKAFESSLTLAKNTLNNIK